MVSHSSILGASLVIQIVKNLPVMWETWVRSLGREGNGYPLQYSHLENSMDRGGLAGYNPCGCKESVMTEQPILIFFKPIIASSAAPKATDPLSVSIGLCILDILYKPNHTIHGALQSASFT